MAQIWIRLGLSSTMREARMLGSQTRGSRRLSTHNQSPTQAWGLNSQALAISRLMQRFVLRIFLKGDSTLSFDFWPRNSWNLFSTRMISCGFSQVNGEAIPCKFRLLDTMKGQTCISVLLGRNPQEQCE